MFYIYKITNLVNGKIYIGKAADVTRRWSSHKSIARTGGPNYYAIHAAIRKYGVENFIIQVIDQLENESNALVAEANYISLFHSKDRLVGYNLTDGGEGTSGHTYVPTQEHKEKLSKAHIGIPLSVEHRASISQSLLGEKNPNFGGKFHKTMPVFRAFGTANPSAKLNQEIANQIRKDYKQLPSSRKLAKVYGVSPSTILHIIRNEVWIKD